jgi:hypothetical protein
MSKQHPSSESREIVPPTTGRRSRGAHAEDNSDYDDDAMLIPWRWWRRQCLSEQWRHYHPLPGPFQVSDPLMLLLLMMTMMIMMMMMMMMMMTTMTHLSDPAGPGGPAAGGDIADKGRALDRHGHRVPREDRTARLITHPRGHARH